MMLKPDCRHFPGSRPCRFNKESGQTCPDCAHYRPKGFRILIVKLDALGDVLRTTAILPGLKAAWPDAYVVWITRAQAADLLRNNPLVDEVWCAETDAPARLRVESFDLVLNPDADKWTAALASQARATERRGLFLDERGNLAAANPEAQEWLEMGAFDSVKVRNRKSYQQILYELCRLPWAGQEIVLPLTAPEREEARAFLQGREWAPGDRLVAVNLGGGGRWKRKRWSEAHLLETCRTLAGQPGIRVLLVAGPTEKSLEARMIRALPSSIIPTGTDLTLRQLAALLAQCAVVLTGDSLAMLMAIALRVPVVALFGPTSAAEIELYGRGEKIVSPAPCATCYLPDCHREPDCMEQIRPDGVLKAIRRQLDACSTSVSTSDPVPD
jgi:heptosyltransferase-2